MDFYFVYFEDFVMKVSGQLVQLMADATARGCWMALCPSRSDRVTVRYPAPRDNESLRPGDPIFGVLRAHRDDLVTLARAADKGAS